MEAMEKVKMLQAIYAGALADMVMRMGNEGVLEKITSEKRVEQLSGGKLRAGQMGITKAEEVFVKLSDLMGCANWNIEPNQNGNGFTATATRCMLCAIAKKMGTQSPCHIYCLDPMEGMVKGIDEATGFEVLSTLYGSDSCRVAVLE